MDISICARRLLDGLQSLANFPPEIFEIIGHGNNSQYLNSISQLALDPRYTTLIFTSHKAISLEICARWRSMQQIDDLTALASLALVLPSDPYLSVYARAILARRVGTLSCLNPHRATGLLDLPEEKLSTILLTLLRLLSFDNQEFGSSVYPAQLGVLLRSAHPHIIYLAIRILNLYLHGSDCTLNTMMKEHIGEGEIPGKLGERLIDYTFYDLEEAKRLTELSHLYQSDRLSEFIDSSKSELSIKQRIIHSGELSPNVANVAGILLPRTDGILGLRSTLIMTSTTSKNLRALAQGVKSGKPLLVTGCPGVGKSSAIEHIANLSGKSSSMITLHLNEQTDAKLLIGMYTSANSPSGFAWRPGTLTKAVMEGRWLVIEDIDRAPTEIISTLLPLLERGELSIPSWGQSCPASPDFKLFATMRSAPNAQGEEVLSSKGMIGIRHWSRISFDTQSDGELGEIMSTQFPILQAFLSKILNIYHTLNNTHPANVPSPTTGTNGLRPLRPPDLFKLCYRVQDLLQTVDKTTRKAIGKATGNEPISQELHDHNFLEVVDCFLGACLPSLQRTWAVGIIAQNLHMPTERSQYCLHDRKPEYHSTESAICIGRATISIQDSPFNRRSMTRFAKTDTVLRILESLAVTVKQAEPCLLVGETGTGKTAAVQYLAEALGRKLMVFNLSQQSEAGDLLGGYKPVNMRTLAMPLKEEFEELMEKTFTSQRNQHYVQILGKAVVKGRWSRALALWKEALQTIAAHFKPTGEDLDVPQKERCSKRRKTQYSKYQSVEERWKAFAARVETFEMHLASGSKGFAFSFVEGDIVKAARNGEWVLLDEINLATPDTLECLADLFSCVHDARPSILLTDSGDTERVYAHKDFRIFGAMNPATDIGKRDLPMSLRSRFTELAIETPDKDLKSLEPLIALYLAGYGHTRVGLATNVANLHIEIKTRADEHDLADGAGQKPHFSLRTLIRTLTYALDVTPIYSLRRALFESFSMSYLTVLNRNSVDLIQPLIERYILGDPKTSKAILGQKPCPPADGKPYVHFDHYYIAQGAAPITRQDRYIITPFIKQNLLNLVRATSTRKFPVLLQGPTSSGKTSMIEYLARISGNHFVRINNHEHTDLQEYLGTYVSDPDGQLRYQEGILVNALREGHWVVLDELNLAPTDVLEALNRLLDDNRELLIPETQQIVRPHENFMLFATQNPAGIYGGRKTLSRAFRNRFLELHFDDIPDEELETILRERSQIAPSFCNKIVAVYQKLAILRRSERLFEQKDSFVTLRDLFRWALRDADNREQLAVNGFLLLAERVRNEDERLAIKGVIEEVMKVKINEDSLYSATSIEQDYSLPGIVWTRSMRRLHVLVTEALKNNEPVLLVGETGSGKTTICQMVAHQAQRMLHIVNAHQNMETSDLIGSQRPNRSRHLAKAELYQMLTTILDNNGMTNHSLGDNLPMLLKDYDNLRHSAPESVSDADQSCVQALRTSSQSLFEWSDGSLVKAMRHGQHFLLDEISLADDSTLERLNSVLEPERLLFLAEKSTSDALVSAAPGFQLLATMNPGGDYGKRELSPALRNRFTEIWASGISSVEEMLDIVQAKLSPHLTHFGKPMVNFSKWFAASFRKTNAIPSIRDLLAWIDFIDATANSGPYASVVHGAAVVYLDRLGADPTSQMSSSVTSISEQRSTCLTKLNHFFDYDLKGVFETINDFSSTNTQLEIGPFLLPKTPRAISSCRYSLQAPTTMANAMKVMRALQLRRPILLEGSPGVGKTTLVATLAQEIGKPLTRINLSDQTDLMDLFGSDVPIDGAAAGHFGWRDAPFLRAMQNGEWVLLDEMNLASQSILEGLNSCFDHRGSVYISELDKVFHKHPNFVVFAAQNPHSQGGGRKGLPASFIDRFSVVYADPFTLDDMITISSEIYPSVPRSVREQICRAVIALNQNLQQDRMLGPTGGPWEINLRDVLRWLHLLASQNGLMPFATAADYRSLLFEQRFRTNEDRSVISSVLEQYFPRDQNGDVFYGKSENLLELGKGLLPRNEGRRSTSKLGLAPQNSNLLLLESIMLCVQQQWPCLLVGASGSGKSSLILQLADMVGRDVVTLCLGPEMDTSDLIGGYEQLNGERKAMAFKMKVTEYVHTQLLSQLGIKDDPSESLTSLTTVLGSEDVTIATLLPLIRSITQQYPSTEFDTFLTECERLVQHKADDSRARFEWVDGTLVEAVRQGKWLILDNANLCNASVLDRLNSLLEPGGVLSINEHRNADGSAQIVKPHEDFRLFLTMDPNRGELSQAMRNRSVELFVSSESSRPSTKILDPQLGSAVSNFALFQSFNWNKRKDDDLARLVGICFDHLSFDNYATYRRWKSQLTQSQQLHSFSPVQTSLFSLSRVQESLFDFVAEQYSSMLRHDGGTLLQAIQQTYQDLGSSSGASSSSFCTLQTIHPYNNPLLLSLTECCTPLRNLRWLGSCLELLSEIHGFIVRLDAFRGTLTLDVARPTKTTRASVTSMDTTQPVISFLTDMVVGLRSIVDGREFHGETDRQGTLLISRNILNFLQDIFDLAQSSDLDEATYHVFYAIGNSICGPGKTFSDTNPVAMHLINELHTKLDRLNAPSRMNSGLGMEVLWSVFMPAIARNSKQLNLKLCIQKLANSFDEVKWSSSAAIEELLTSQDALIQMLNDAGDINHDDNGLLNAATEALDHIKVQSVSDLPPVSPYFQVQFDAIAQVMCYDDQRNNLSRLDLGRINLLSGRPTAHMSSLKVSPNARSAIYDLAPMTAIGVPATELAAVRNTVPISVLKRLQSVEETPLQALNLLHVEVELLAKVICNSSKSISFQPLNRLYYVLGTLASEIRPMLSENILQDATNPSTLTHLLRRSAYNTDSSVSFNTKLQHLHRCLQDVKKFEMRRSKRTSDQSFESFAEAGFTYTNFFTGCLLLFVPDRPYDPALRQIVDLMRHGKRTRNLETRLRALHEFEEVYTGNRSSFRIQLAEQEVKTLDGRPTISPVLRPEISELADLQTEFTAILNSIVLKSPDVDISSLNPNKRASHIQEIELIRVNIAQAVKRLSQRFRSYEDITRPLIAMLQGLDIGWALTLLSNSQRESIDLTVNLCAMTPLMGANAKASLISPLQGIGTSAMNTSERCIILLQRAVLQRSVHGELDSSEVQPVLRAFHELFQEWKTQLTRDQQHHASNSSLYRYRGGDEDHSAGDNQDFASLFPDAEGASKDSKTPAGLAVDPKSLAQKLAAIHRELFVDIQEPSQGILGLLQDTSNKIVGLWQDQDGKAIYSSPVDVLFPALLLSLDATSSHLQCTRDPGSTYNFYSEANIAEVQKLTPLVKDIQQSFSNIQEAWPENATLADVRRSCSELLAMRHSDPIAKLLTKTEQLHGYVYEWQRDASREYSVASLYSQLTKTLISWRRLELATWAQLLDMEDKRCHEDADTWWFIAYEVIIAAPLSLVEAGESLHIHTQQLVDTLAEFLRTTSIGQYTHRMNMIGCFKDHLFLAMKEVPSLSVVHNAISNFLVHYMAFENPVRDHLRHGRHALEKEVKEVLLLASWKDTTIDALRSSAKRSHHELFKVIRKYRCLLAEPAEIIIAQGIPHQITQMAISGSAFQTLGPSDVSPDALQVCRQRIPGWEEKPARFIHPNSTADQMLQMSQPASDRINGCSYLDSLTLELKSNIEILRKETPAKANEDNSDFCKHLKSRKRKLYNDTLKSLRQMGFRTNISAEALENQASTSKILTDSPAMNASPGQIRTTAIEVRFHELLSTLPQARERSRQHSDDLRPGEVTKSLAYLESMLAMILRQRKILEGTLNENDRLHQTIQKIKVTCTLDSDSTIIKDNGKFRACHEGCIASKWLRAILTAGSVIIDKYSRLCPANTSVVSAKLASWKENIDLSLRAYDDLPNFPDGLVSRQHKRVLSETSRLMQEIKDDLQQLAMQTPEFDFILKQMELWASLKLSKDPGTNVDMTNESHQYNIAEFDKTISTVFDRILVATQQLKGVNSSLPTSDEDKEWLLRIDQSLETGWQSIQSHEISNVLNKAMNNMHNLESPDGSGFTVAVAMCSMALPVIEQFQNVQQLTLARHLDLHRSICDFALLLTQSFCQIARDGFCDPADNAAEKGKVEHTEGGTGLGAGEGAEDISKDVGDDEDLSELAQQNGKDKDREEIEDEKDAVDMDRDDLEGDLGSEEKGEDEGSADEDEGENIDEEQGSVDSLDPAAVDEKLWDGKAEATDKEKHSAKAKGKVEKNEQEAADSNPQQETTEGEEDDPLQEDDNEGAEEGEQVAKEEDERIDPHTQEGQSLDLPEHMDLDSMNNDDDQSDLEDSDKGDASDINDDENAEMEDIDTPGSDMEEIEASNPHPEQSKEVGKEGDSEDTVGSPVDTEPSDSEQGDDQRRLPTQTENMDTEEVVSSDAQGLSNEFSDDVLDNSDTRVGQPQLDKKSKAGYGRGEGGPKETEDHEISDQTGQPQLSKQSKAGPGRGEGVPKEAKDHEMGPDMDRTRDNPILDEQSPFKKLGDALEEYHRRKKQVLEPSDQENDTQALNNDAEMADVDLEHLRNDSDIADTQALGAASDEQARALDEKAAESEVPEKTQLLPRDDAEAEEAKEDSEAWDFKDPTTIDARRRQKQLQASTFVDNKPHGSERTTQSGFEDIEDMDSLDKDLSVTHIQPTDHLTSCTVEEARRLWSHYEGTTHSLSLSLTEQFRLILAPTLATKMRGDFRTGKRLNIKRIISYIASDFKRDKIWMRRSIPSKRNYQIMLAVDNSKSMGESGSGHLAFETLALVAKSLSMLEVGQICIVGFGNDVQVAHEFEKPFSSEAGAQVFQHFGFQEKTTNVRKLVAESIKIFRDAKAKTYNAGALWQLELIISDGVCEDHDSIRRLVRQAQEERIMIIFVIVDALLKEESIMDMSQAVFEPDADGTSKLKIKRYLDGFPFPYYLVVGNVRELPNVLAQALRQWFNEIATDGE